MYKPLGEGWLTIKEIEELQDMTTTTVHGWISNNQNIRRETKNWKIYVNLKDLEKFWIEKYGTTDLKWMKKKKQKRVEEDIDFQNPNNYVQQQSIPQQQPVNNPQNNVNIEEIIQSTVETVSAKFEAEKERILREKEEEKERILKEKEEEKARLIKEKEEEKERNAKVERNNQEMIEKLNSSLRVVKEEKEDWKVRAEKIEEEKNVIVKEKEDLRVQLTKVIENKKMITIFLVLCVLMFGIYIVVTTMNLINFWK